MSQSTQFPVTALPLTTCEMESMEAHPLTFPIYKMGDKAG